MFLLFWQCLGGSADFFNQSVEHPVEEQLKDPNSGDISFEDVLRVSAIRLMGRATVGRKREGGKERKGKGELQVLGGVDEENNRK